MKISFYTLGCKANQADNSKIKTTASQFGWQIVDYGEKCDYCVINICSVTGGAEQRSRQMLRSAKKHADHVIASGCFIEKISEIDLYFKNPNEVIEYLKKIHSSDALAQPKSPQGGTPFAGEKTRAMIRIQDGCNFSCSYCLIHKMRGQAKSRPADEIINDIIEKENQGFKEVILTGINILQYLNITALLQKVLNETDMPRIRLGSIDPRLVTDEFLELFKNPRLLPHLHLSLQSGSDKILKLMNRNYTAKKYLDIISRARKIDPLFSFTTDVIVGFPGEDSADVEATIDLIEIAQFTKVHIFPFSERPGTDAVGMANKIDPQTIKQRLNLIERKAAQVQKKLLKNYLNKKMDVLIEEKKDNSWHGYTPYYFKVKINSNNDLENKIVSTTISLDNLLAS